jgi:small subunit ribosomal protein S2
MAPYIWGQRSGIYLIDVSKTANQIEKAAQFLQSIAAQGKQILWVGTKKPAQGVVGKVGQSLKMPYVTYRWIGGTLTNNSQVRKSITRLLHFEDILKKSAEFSYTKKELGTFNKIAGRLDKNVGGIRTLRWPVGAVVLVDVRKEQTALREATAMGIPVVALVDTNGDPSLVSYVIPANDDSPKSVELIIDYLGQAAQQGLTAAAQHKADKAAAATEETVPTEETNLVELKLAGFDEEETAENKKKGPRRPATRPVRKP